MTRFPRHGDNVATRAIPPDLRDKSPDQIARAMAERLAHARMIEAELAAEGDGFVTIYPPRDQERKDIDKMAIVYKLTDQNMQTHDGCQWALGEAKETSGEGILCGPGGLHYYHDPLLAVMLNPAHANISDPRLFEAEAEGARNDDHGLKGGCTKLTLLRELAMPEVTTTQRVRFGILCAMQVSTNLKWRVWAEDWLSGKDRSKQAAEWAAARATASAAAAEWAAELAADAAAAAEWAAELATKWAAAARAARAAAQAAEVKPLDLIALAKQAVEEDV